MSNKGIRECENDNNIIKDLTKCARYKQENQALKVLIEDGKEELDVEEIPHESFQMILVHCVVEIHNKRNQVKKEIKRQLRNLSLRIVR